MSSILDRLGLARKHRHEWEFPYVYSGAANTVKVQRCACGEETRELTPAGYQQIGWWVELGLSREEAYGGVLAGALPYPMVWLVDENRWALTDTRSIA